MAEVVIYTRQLCGFCTAAKRLLDKKGVAYTQELLLKLHAHTTSKEMTRAIEREKAQEKKDRNEKKKLQKKLTMEEKKLEDCYA